MASMALIRMPTSTEAGTRLFPEYFSGLSFGLRNFYVSPGIHIARFQDLGGGFQLGHPVPTGWTTSTPVPTTYRFTARFGFGITYKIH
jgi:hypothetical protein